jgi:hypothetical protein
MEAAEKYSPQVKAIHEFVVSLVGDFSTDRVERLNTPRLALYASSSCAAVSH